MTNLCDCGRMTKNPPGGPWETVEDDSDEYHHMWNVVCDFSARLGKDYDFYAEITGAPTKEDAEAICDLMNQRDGAEFRETLNRIERERKERCATHQE